jgi:hypothetical protein
MRLGYNITSGFDIWTSATGKGSSRIEWCANTKEFDEAKINWKNGQPNRADGDCTALVLSSVNANSTTLSQRNCMEKRRYVCEVCIYLFLNTNKNALGLSLSSNYREKFLALEKIQNCANT